MSTLTTTLSGGFGRSASPHRPLKSGASRLFSALGDLLSAKNDVDALRALKDRDLADIGLSRADLPVDLAAEIDAMQRALGFHYGR